MLEPFVIVLLTVMVIGAASRRFGLVEPTALLIAGIGIGLVPAADAIELAPELILTIVLPALLYWESLTTSLREVRNNLRVIILLAVGLVLFTTPVVAAALHYGNGTDWTTAFIIGAVLAPTDAAAVAAIAYMLPRRFQTVLRAESLINDGTALVLVAAAVEVAMSGEDPHWGTLWIDLLISYAGGVAVGLAVAGVIVVARRKLTDPLLGTVLSIATPFIAFLPAEEIHVSGVLAVVVCGLTLARYTPRHIPAESRLRSYSFWGLTTYLLNAALFVLVGIELPQAARALESHSLRDGVLAVVIATSAVVLGRFVWDFLTTTLIRTLDRRPQQRERRVSTRQRMPTAWAGVRGGISLAAALSVPLTTDAGSRFAERDFIVFVAGGTVLLSLVIQGSTLPRVIRWARYPDDDTPEREHHLARHAIMKAALDHLDATEPEDDLQRDVVAMMRETLDRQRATLPDDEHETPADGTEDALTYENALQLEIIDSQRDALTELRNNGEIDGAIYLQLESVLDSDELNLQLTRDSRSGELRGPE